MIPADWPSFWLGVLAWPLVTIISVILLGLLWELSDALNRFEAWMNNLTAEAQARRELG